MINKATCGNDLCYCIGDCSNRSKALLDETHTSTTSTFWVGDPIQPYQVQPYIGQDVVVTTSFGTYNEGQKEYEELDWMLDGARDIFFQKVVNDRYTSIVFNMAGFVKDSIKVKTFNDDDNVGIKVTYDYHEEPYSYEYLLSLDTEKYSKEPVVSYKNGMIVVTFQVSKEYYTEHKIQ